MKKLLAGFLLLFVVPLTGCTINVNSQDDTHHMVGENTDLSAADLMFAQMMIPHHQQAVDLGGIAATRASSPEVLALAKQIASEQEPEIELMKSWLGDSQSANHMDHDMAMDGMLTEVELETLKAAKGAAFDRLFLEGMIAHHEGAISMAQAVVDSKNSEVAELAASIIESQTKQIKYMKELLGN